MNSVEKAKIQQRLTYLKEHISEIDVVVDHLVTLKTFSLEQRSQIIQQSSPPRDNIQRMIDKLLTAGPDAFSNLLTALTKTGNGNCHVAEILKSEEVAATRGDKFVIEKGSKEEESETDGNELSLKELSKGLLSLTSRVAVLEDNEKIYIEKLLITKKELEKKENECRNLEKQLQENNRRLEIANKGNFKKEEKILELEKTNKRLENELSEERLKIKELENTLAGKKEDDNNEISLDSDVKLEKTESKEKVNKYRKVLQTVTKVPFCSTANSRNVSQNAYYGALTEFHSPRNNFHSPRNKKKTLLPLEVKKRK